MARTAATHNDSKITAMLADVKPVAAIATELGVSQPTVYNAIKRLGLALPGAVAANAPVERSAKNSVSKSPTAGRRRPGANSNVETSAMTVPSVSVVPVTDKTLLTVRVDKGIENLRNLSARIVKLERDLDAARQRYAETLASLALD